MSGIGPCHGMSLKLGQSLVGHSLSLCSIFVSACLVGRAHILGSKVLWVFWCPYPSTGSPALLQEVVTPGSISPIARRLSQSHPPRLPGASHIPDVWHFVGMPCSPTTGSIHFPGSSPRVRFVILHKHCRITAIVVSSGSQAG